MIKRGWWRWRWRHVREEETHAASERVHQLRPLHALGLADDLTPICTHIYYIPKIYVYMYIIWIYIYVYI